MFSFILNWITVMRRKFGDRDKSGVFHQRTYGFFAGNGLIRQYRNCGLIGNRVDIV